MKILRRDVPAVIACGLLGMVMATAVARADDSGRAAADAARRPPNIVVLIADDLGYAELGCQSGEDLPTPQIDSIAMNGVRFTSGYVTAPFCAASRAGLMTGRYQTRFGFEHNIIGARNAEPRAGLPAGEVTLAEHLRSAGYATGLVGKWHLGGTAARHPLRHGFEEFYGFLHEGHSYMPQPRRDVTTMLRRKHLPPGYTGRWTSDDGLLILSDHLGYDEPPYDADNPILRDGQPVEERDYLTDAFTRESIDFIDRNAARPFLLCVAYNAVHSPMQALNEDVDRFQSEPDIQRRIFLAMLARLDTSVGQILERLEHAGLTDDTLVVFLSDNGGPTRELTSRNLPLRGEKGELFEGGIRVPFLMQWPGVLPAGHVEASPVVSLDVFATAAAAAGVTTSHRIDGVDLRPWLTGRSVQPPHPQLYWRVGTQGALRSGDWKIVRTGSESDAWQMYHLTSDPAESRDLAAQEPAWFNHLLGEWRRIDAHMQPATWEPGL
jgi:arylsulfatase A-like enzyme